MADADARALDPAVATLAASFELTASGELHLPRSALHAWDERVVRRPTKDWRPLAIDLIALAVKLDRINPTHTRDVRIELLVLASSLGLAIETDALAGVGLAADGAELDRRIQARRSVGSALRGESSLLGGLAAPGGQKKHRP